MVGLILAACLLGQPVSGAFSPRQPDSNAFIQNIGQWNPRALYKGSARGVDLWVTANGLTLDFHSYKDGNDKNKIRTGTVVRMSVAKASGWAKAVGSVPVGGRVSYIGEEGRFSGARRFRQVNLRQVAPGLATRFYFENGVPRYDLILAPGASPNAARLRYEGAKNLRVSPEGRLRYDTGQGTVEERGLYVYQDTGRGRTRIEASQLIHPDGTVGFKLGSYDTSKPLVIDPAVWSTYLGGTSYDYAKDVAVDPVGNPVVVSETFSSDFPTTAGSYTSPATASSVLSKLSADGKQLLWSTFFSDGDLDAVDVAPDGTVVAVGSTFGDWPVQPITATTPPSWNVGSIGIARLSADGSTLLMARKFGSAAGGEEAAAVDATSDAIVIGGTATNGDLPGLNGTLQTTYASQFNAGFVARMTAEGNEQWTTLIGNSQSASVSGVVLDPEGRPVVMGAYRGAGMPGLPDNSLAPEYGYLMRLSSDGGTQEWASCFRSVYGDPDYAPSVSMRGLALDAAGNVHVIGGVNSDLDGIEYLNQGIATAAEGVPGGMGDVFVAKLDPSGAHLWSSIGGGTGYEEAVGIGVTSAGDVAAVAYSDSSDLSVTTGMNSVGIGDIWLQVIDKDGVQQRSEVLGGSDWDYPHASALHTNGRLVVAGETFSADLPMIADSYQSSSVGGDAFLMAIQVGSTSQVPTKDPTFTLSQSSVIGSKTLNVIGTVTFPAPLSADTVLRVQTVYESPTTDTYHLVPAGAVSVDIPISTQCVMGITNGTVTVTEPALGQLTAPLILLPPAIDSVSVDSEEIDKGRSVHGTITLVDPAPDAGQSVRFRTFYYPSMTPADDVASVAEVIVPAGSNSQSFVVKTKTVKTTVKIVVVAPGDKRSTPITLRPPGKGKA